MKRLATAALLLAPCLTACRPTELPKEAAANPYADKLQPWAIANLNGGELDG